MAQFPKDNWLKAMCWIQTLLVPIGEQLSFGYYWFIQTFLSWVWEVIQYLIIRHCEPQGYARYVHVYLSLFCLSWY